MPVNLFIEGKDGDDLTDLLNDLEGVRAPRRYTEVFDSTRSPDREFRPDVLDRIIADRIDGQRFIANLPAPPSGIAEIERWSVTGDQVITYSGTTGRSVLTIEGLAGVRLTTDGGSRVDVGIFNADGRPIEGIRFRDNLDRLIAEDGVGMENSGGGIAFDGTGKGDRLIGGQRDDTLAGQGGNDEIRGGGGADELEGGRGRDLIYGELDSQPADPLRKGSTADTIDGGPQNDIIYGEFGGGARNDLPGKGRTSGDEIDGGPGKDFIVGGPGNDTIDGGASDDEIHGRFDNEDFFVDEIGGLANEKFDDDVLKGGKGRDILLGQTGDDRLEGGPQDDILSGDGVGDERLRPSQTAPLEALFGDPRTRLEAGNDTLLGGPGNDILLGDVGRDSLDGGPGGDVAAYMGSNSRLDVDLGAGRVDTINGPRIDRLTSIEHFIGGLRDDVIKGNDDANVLAGGFGDDILIGAGGNDLLFAGMLFPIGTRGANQPFVDELKTYLELLGTVEPFNIDVGKGSLPFFLVSETAPNGLIGGAGKDTLIGSDGEDDLSGGRGNDLLAPGKGIDILTGGPGRDQFFFRPDDGRNTIRDFAPGQDQIRIEVPLGSGDDFDDLAIRDGQNGAIVRYGDLVIRLDGVDAADLGPDDFFVTDLVFPL